MKVGDRVYCIRTNCDRDTTEGCIYEVANIIDSDSIDVLSDDFRLRRQAITRFLHVDEARRKGYLNDIKV
jgi:hypothetical protein